MNCNIINKSRLKATLSIVALSIASATLTACNSTGNSDGDRSMQRASADRMDIRDRGDRRSDRSDRGDRRADRGSNEDMHSRIEGAKKRVEAAVESGEMTREEADAIYGKMKERMDKNRPSSRREWSKMNLDGLKARIDAAVESGEITREEGDERLRIFKERMNKEEGKGQKHKSHEDRKQPSDD